CMVEIEGERVLAASCIRRPIPGMKVQAASERAKASRQLVFELLIGDQPERAAAHDPDSRLWQWADALDVSDSRFPRRAQPAPDRSHPAMAVQLDACIHCNLCVRACREVQVNDVIGMAGRGHGEKIVFDFDDPMGRSTCVACGECVQAYPLTHFRVASWDEALDRAAAGLKRIRDRDGRYALAGFGSAKGSNEEAYLFQKLVRTGFGSNNVDHCTRLCHASSVAALMEGIGSGAVTAPVT